MHRKKIQAHKELENEMKAANFPDLKLVEAARLKIRKMYTEEQLRMMDPDMLEDFAKMAACLTPEAVAKQLNKLSNILEEALRDMKLLDTDLSIKKKPDKEYTSNYKLISTIMEDWAQKNGFNQTRLVHCLQISESKKERVQIELPPISPIVFGQLKGSTFRGVLQSLGYIFKDIGVSVRHGEFTHFLALYAIVELNKENQFLKYPVIELYKKMGCYPYVDYQTDRSIWDIIFDSRELISLNSPEALNDAIRGIRTKTTEGFMERMHNYNIKILSEAVEGRSKKRSAQMGEKKIVANAAIRKYSNTPGLVIDEGILFKNEAMSRETYIFDEVSDECSYDPKLNQKYIAPRFAEDASCFEKLIMIFDSKNWYRESKDLQELAKIIQEELRNLYAESLSHRVLSKYLTNLFIENQDKPYLQFLINCAQGVLLKDDEQLKKLKNDNESKRPKIKKT